MKYLVLHNYRKFEGIILENILQIFFALSIGMLMLVLSSVQFKDILQTFAFSYYANIFIRGFLIASHVLAILLIKKTKEDLYFQEYVRKNSLWAFAFRWRREIGMLLFFDIFLTIIIGIMLACINHYMYFGLLLLLAFCFFIIGLFFLIQVTMNRSLKKFMLLILYYAFVIVTIIMRNNWLATAFALLFVGTSIYTYDELNYIRPLYQKKTIKARKKRIIKDYVDFILIYIVREQIYLELAIFSSIITIIPLILNFFQMTPFLLNNIGLVNILWNLLITEMSALLAVGFSELIKLHGYFFLKNKFNKYVFTFLYLFISFIISSFFVIIPGVSLSYYTKLQIVDLPFIFVELIGIILLGMYISLFFPATRKKTPVLAFVTITVLWLLIKQFMVEKVSYNPPLLFALLLFMHLLLYSAIVIEISNLSKGVVMEKVLPEKRIEKRKKRDERYHKNNL